MYRGAMETMSEAVVRLELRGFDRAFNATKGGQLEVRGEAPFDPETLLIRETVRFEGQSDPADEAVLFALSTRDGRLRGTFVASFGPHTDPDCAAAIHRLPASPPAITRTGT